MRLPKHVEQAILSKPGVKITKHAKKPKRAGKKQLVEPSITLKIGGKLAATIPVETSSEINSRQWRARHRRTGAAWNAVKNVFGPNLSLLAGFAEAYHRGQTLNIVFTRLDKRRLDEMANLGTSMKAVEDALAFIMGANDGDLRWKARPAQEHSDLIGVRIEMEIAP